MTLTRNTSLDILKGVAALFVIWIHEQFPGVTGQLVNRTGAFAVPVFFMVSGFFGQNASRRKLEKSIRHILTLIGIAYGLNLLRILVFDGGTAMVDALIDAFSPRTLILWILLNITPISGVAWFLFALLYCYILHWLFHRWITNRRVFLLIPVCIAGGLAVRLLMPSIGTNDAWFCGIPCYLIGSWYRVNQEHLAKIPVSQYIAGTVLGLGMLIGSFVLPCSICHGSFPLRPLHSLSRRQKPPAEANWQYLFVLCLYRPCADDPCVQCHRACRGQCAAGLDPPGSDCGSDHWLCCVLA